MKASDLLNAAVNYRINGDKPPPEVIDYLLDGVAEFTGGMPLNEALSLTDGDRTRWALAQRNQHLKTAWETLPGSPWKKSKVLLERVERYEQARWQFEKNKGLPETANELHAALYRALSCGQALPETVKGIHEAVLSVDY